MGTAGCIFVLLWTFCSVNCDPSPAANIVHHPMHGDGSTTTEDLSAFQSLLHDGYSVCFSFINNGTAKPPSYEELLSACGNFQDIVFFGRRHDGDGVELSMQLEHPLGTYLPQQMPFCCHAPHATDYGLEHDSGSYSLTSNINITLETPFITLRNSDGGPRRNFFIFGVPSETHSLKGPHDGGGVLPHFGHTISWDGSHTDDQAYTEGDEYYVLGRPVSPFDSLERQGYEECAEISPEASTVPSVEDILHGCGGFNHLYFVAETADGLVAHETPLGRDFATFLPREDAVHRERSERFDIWENYAFVSTSSHLSLNTRRTASTQLVLFEFPLGTYFEPPVRFSSESPPLTASRLWIYGRAVDRGADEPDFEALLDQDVSELCDHYIDQASREECEEDYSNLYSWRSFDRLGSDYTWFLLHMARNQVPCEHYGREEVTIDDKGDCYLLPLSLHFPPFKGTVPRGHIVDFIGTLTVNHSLCGLRASEPKKALLFDPRADACQACQNASADYYFEAQPFRLSELFLEDFVQAEVASHCSSKSCVMVELGGSVGIQGASFYRMVEKVNPAALENIKIINVEADLLQVGKCIGNFKLNGIKMSHMDIFPNYFHFNVNKDIHQVSFPSWDLSNRWDDVPFISLQEVLGDYDSVDLLHADIQGGEADLVKSERLLDAKVKVVHIGTHTLAIGDALHAMFTRLDWLQIFSFAHNNRHITPWGNVYIDDGVMVFVNRRFFPELQRNNATSPNVSAVLEARVSASGAKEYFVHYEGLPAMMGAWVREHDLGHRGLRLARDLAS